MFNNGNSGIVPVMPMGGNMGYGMNGMGGFGDGWWAIIILFALFGWGGFGNGGFGGNGNGTGYIDAAIQRGFDNQTVVNKLDGISNGLCSLGYDQLAQMNGINTNILTVSNSLMAQLQQCCCNIEKGQMQAEYNRATDTCTITTAIKDAVTAITQNCNANYRSLYDQQVQQEMNALKAQNAELSRQLERCDDRNLINEQTQYLTNYLRPQANPAFVVPAPWFAGGYYNGGYGCNNGGCCNNGFGF